MCGFRGLKWRRNYIVWLHLAPSRVLVIWTQRVCFPVWTYPSFQTVDLGWLDLLLWWAEEVVNFCCCSFYVRRLERKVIIASPNFRLLGFAFLYLPTKVRLFSLRTWQEILRFERVSCSISFDLILLKIDIRDIEQFGILSLPKRIFIF